MKSFNEQAMIAGLCNRDQDARDMRKIFDPNWLKDAELQPILRGIYEYMDTEKIVPSLAVLMEFMEEKDKEKYNNRWKAALEQLRGIDDKVQIRAIKGARDAAATYALSYLLNEARFQQLVANGNAEAVKQDLSKWLHTHSSTTDEGLFSIQEALDKLVDEYDWRGRGTKTLTGIHAIDEWSGGQRPPQMGLIVAPTGHGKSTVLMNIALHGAAIEGKTVLFITNEMTVNEQSERFLVRLHDKTDESGKYKKITLTEIQEDPTLAYVQLKGYRSLLNDKLFIYSANLGQNVNGVDDIVTRLRNERGVFPDMIVIDYMERMSTVERISKESSWIYLGQLAKELLWLAKRRNAIIWSAVQTNRGGNNPKNELDITVVQGSIQHIQEAAYVIGVRKVKVTDEQNKERRCMEFKEMKARHGEMDYRKMYLEADLSRMYISNTVVKSYKDVEDDNEKVAKNGNGNAPLSNQSGRDKKKYGGK